MSFYEILHLDVFDAQARVKLKEKLFNNSGQFLSFQNYVGLCKAPGLRPPLRLRQSEKADESEFSVAQ